MGEKISKIILLILFDWKTKYIFKPVIQKFPKLKLKLDNFKDNFYKKINVKKINEYYNNLFDEIKKDVEKKKEYLGGNK